MIAIGLKVGSEWRPLDVYVDSGAEYSILKAKIASAIGFDYRTGKRVASKPDLPLRLAAKMRPGCIVNSWPRRFPDWKPVAIRGPCGSGHPIRNQPF